MVPSIYPFVPGKALLSNFNLLSSSWFLYLHLHLHSGQLAAFVSSPNVASPVLVGK